MNWQRGLLLAGIHFAITVPLVLWEEAGVWPYLPDHPKPLRRDTVEQGDEGLTVTFSPDPCSMMGHLSAQETILLAAEMPAMIVSGWRPLCHPSWSVAGLIGADRWLNTRSQERQIAAAFLILVSVQWLFLGALRRVRPRPWYADPGALITACLVMAAIPLCITPIFWAFHWAEFLRLPEGLGILARLPLLVMIPVWLLWPVLFLWKCAAWMRRRIGRLPPQPATGS